MQYARKVHFAEHVQRVVACRAIRAYGHRYPRRGEPVQRRDSGGELRVRAGVRHRPELLAREKLNVLIAHPHAVKAAAAVCEHAYAIQKLRRGHAPALYAALDLALRLAKVHEAGLLVLFRKRGHVLHALHAGGVLGVDAEPVGNKLVIIVKAQVLALYVLLVRVKIIERRAYHRAVAAVDICLGVGFIAHVHVKARCDPGGEIFHYPELCKGIYHLVVELCLVREHLLIKPVTKRHVVCERAQEGHRRVGVRILEARHQQVAAQIDLTLKARRVRALRPDVGDAPAVRPHLVPAYFYPAGKAQHPAVIESYHLFFASSRAHIASCAAFSKVSSSG